VGLALFFQGNRMNADIVFSAREAAKITAFGTTRPQPNLSRAVSEGKTSIHRKTNSGLKPRP
jgi:hypothetical protein